MIGGGCEISESNSEHHGGGPVISPCIFLEPRGQINVFVVHPVLLLVDGSHGDEEDGKDVSETEVEKEDLDEIPVLFVVEVVDEKHFEFLNFFQTLT